MKASVLCGLRDVRYLDVPTPETGAGEVLIRVRVAGICGSDIPRVNAGAAHSYPIVLGHEFSGVVAALGEGVSGLTVGQRVTAAPLIPCMNCRECQKGDYALCKHYTFVGSRRDGAFADYVCVPARNVVPFGEGASFRAGAMIEPSAVALHGVRRANMLGGGRAAVLGGGTIGMFTAEWARLLGAKSVTVFDIDERRLALSKRLGADEAVDSRDEAAMKRLDSSFDYVFETAGRNETMNLAFDMAAARASVCFIGTSPRDLAFDWKRFEKMNRKEFTLTGSWMSHSAPFPGDEWTLTCDYLSRGLLRFDEGLIGGEYPMARAAEAFSDLAKGPMGGRVLLTNEEENDHAL